MGLKWVWTIPNILSLFRIVLVPVFAVLYGLSGQHEPLLYAAVAVLILSGVTDMLDGFIARRFHQISEIGKVLDPIADKLTQVTVMVCLAVRIPQLWPMMAIGFLKELLQSIGAALLLLKLKTAAPSARWYGKVSTVVFYTVMTLFVVFPPAPQVPLLFGWNMPTWLFILLAGLVVFCMLLAFAQYTRMYVTIVKEEKASHTATDSDAQEGANS